MARCVVAGPETVHRHGSERYGTRKEKEPLEKTKRNAPRSSSKRVTRLPSACAIGHIFAMSAGLHPQGASRAGRFSESYLRFYCCSGGERLLDDAVDDHRVIPHGRGMFSRGGDSRCFSYTRNVLLSRTRFPRSFFWKARSLNECSSRCNKETGHSSPKSVLNYRLERRMWESLSKFNEHFARWTLSPSCFSRACRAASPSVMSLWRVR